MTKRQFLKVVETATGKAVREVDCTGMSARMVEKAILGMLRNMDTERFHVEDANAYRDAAPREEET